MILFGTIRRVSISAVVGLRDLLLGHVRSDDVNRVMFHDGGDVLSPSPASLGKQNTRLRDLS